MTYKNAENQTYESRTEATGREYLFRKVCGEAPLPTGKGGADRRGSGGSHRSQLRYPVRLGRGTASSHIRKVSENCGNLQCFQNTDITTQRITEFRQRLNVPLDCFKASPKISPVNLMGGIPRIAKPASARPVKLTLNRQKQSGFCALTLTTKTKEVRA